MTPGKTVLRFVKASACGNDFLIADGTAHLAELKDLTVRMCDRHNGIGADGVEWIFPDPECDAEARLINSDGSFAEVSGNGTRCVAAELCAQRNKLTVTIRTGAGVKTCRLIDRKGESFEFEAEMGQAQVEAPISIETMWVRAVGRKVSVGNPHFAIFVDGFPENWQKQAALIQTQPHFPEGTNVEYVVVRGPQELEIRLFERGAGETQSSGTGSCASAVAAIAAGKVISPVRVVAPGGAQTVRWENQVYLQGPATLICHGEFFV